MKTKMVVKDREVVIPGELLAEGMDYLPSGKAFRDGDGIYSSAIGLVSLRGSVIILSICFSIGVYGSI